MRRLSLLSCAVLAAWSAASCVTAAVLVPESQARRCGLTRAWFAQVGSLGSTGAVNHVRYADGLVLVQTTGGMLTVLDAETGARLWGHQVGPRRRFTTEATASKDYVAVLNGSTLYVMDRASGIELWNRRVGGAPGAGPTATETHLFVPMVDGRIEGYALDGSTKFHPWVYKSSGHVYNSPMATEQSISWTTERGYFYVADPAAGGIRYRLETNDAIHAKPGYWTPNLYAGSSDGFVFAVDEASGELKWKFSIGDAVIGPPVAIGEKVFVITQFEGMTCLDTTTASQLWVAPGITRFLAASGSRIYTCDATNSLVVLDQFTGRRLASMPLVDVGVRLTNPYTDRIYLVGATGAVQCLHEVRLKTPLLHIPPPPEKPEAKLKGKAPADEPPADEPPPEVPANVPDAPPADTSPDIPDVFDGDDPFGSMP